MTDSSTNAFPTGERIRAPRGSVLSCKGWQQEAVLRLFMNSLDPEVAEHAAKSGYDAIVAALRSLANDQTLLVHAGRPAGVFRTHEHAPRVLVSSTERSMHIGMQANLAWAFEVFAAAGQKHFGGGLAGKLVVSGGLGEAGGAQGLAATLNGAAFLGIDADPERIKRRVKTGYCDVMVNDLDESLRILKNAVRKRGAASVGLVGNCADLIPQLAERGIVPDLLTDRTPAYDPVNGYLPRGLDVLAAAELRRRDPDEYRRRSLDSIAAHVHAMLGLQKLGAVTFDSGNGIRAAAFDHGVKDAFDIRASAQDYIRPLLCAGRAPIEWLALSGEFSDIDRTDRLVLEMFPENENLTHWIRLVQKRVRFQGLPARAGWFDFGEHAKFGLALNDLVARGELKAPMAIVREHMDCEPAASNEQTGSTSRVRDAIADWPLLNALLDAASGATCISMQSRPGGSPNHSRYTSQVLAVDGTPETAARIERALSNDCTLDVIRAGCE